MDAWGDESIRVVCDPPVYLLAATYRIDGGEIDPSSLEALRPKSARKLHWRDMGDKARVASIEAVADINASHTIVVGCNIAVSKQERARRKCLEVMLPRLEAMGVNRYILESRESFRDRGDVGLLQSLRAKGVCGGIDLVHIQGSDDARLWIPDQVLGAYGDLRSGVAKASLKSAWNRLSPSVNTVEIFP